MWFSLSICLSDGQTGAQNWGFHALVSPAASKNSTPQPCLWWNEKGPKLRVTKAVIGQSYRFRSFAISICVLLEHIRQWLLIWRSIPCISTESTIWALHGQQSAIHCSSSKCGRSFPQNSLVLALLRAFCLCRFCSSLWILKSKLYSMFGFKARLGHPKYMFQRHSRDGLGLWLPGAPFWQFLVIARLSIWLSINSSGRIRKHAKDCFSSTVIGFGSKFCGQKCVL